MDKVVYALFLVSRVNETVEDFDLELYADLDTARGVFDVWTDHMKRQGFKVQFGLWSQSNDVDSCVASLGNVELSFRLKKMHLL